MISNEFDFTRNDKFYTLSIPKYLIEDDTVLYEFHLKDLVSNKEFVHLFRFKELKEIYQSLNVLKLELPEFPKTHFWRKTNKNPHMIEERRIKLEYFFNIIVNDPFTRGYTEIKKLINRLKYSTQRTHRFSSPPGRPGLTSTTRSHSLSKMSKKQIDIDELKKKSDKNIDTSKKQLTRKSMIDTVRY